MKEYDLKVRVLKTAISTNLKSYTFPFYCTIRTLLEKSSTLIEIFPFSRLRTLLYPNGLLSKERPKPIVNLRNEITIVIINEKNKRQEIINKAIMQT